MWKWIQHHLEETKVLILALGLALTVFGILPGIWFYMIQNEVNAQVLGKVQPALLALNTATTKHEENIKEIRTDLKEIKQDIRNLDQKFTTQLKEMNTKFTQVHGRLVDSRDYLQKLPPHTHPAPGS